MTRRTAPEIIGFVLGWDWNEVKDNAYQPTRFRSPRIYTVGDAYVCCPTDRQSLPKERDSFPEWRVLGTAYGRTVYISGER